MAKKNLNKIDLELEEAKKKVASLENERKLAEENLQQIGKFYVQLQLKKDKNQSYETILDDLKTELAIIKEEEKSKREAVKKERENVEQ